MKKAKRLAIIVCGYTRSLTVPKNYKNFWAQYNSWTQKMYYIYNKTWYLQNEK